MSSELIARVAEQLDMRVGLEDFIPCGLLHATEIGLRRCKSDVLVNALRIIGRDLKTNRCAHEKVVGLCGEMFTIAILMVCSDAEGKITTTDENADDFLDKNHHLIARLVIHAYMLTLPPTALDTMGIVTT
jgi:hypothetical protein